MSMSPEDRERLKKQARKEAGTGQAGLALGQSLLSTFVQSGGGPTSAPSSFPLAEPLEQGSPLGPEAGQGEGLTEGIAGEGDQGELVPNTALEPALPAPAPVALGSPAGSIKSGKGPKPAKDFSMARILNAVVCSSAQRVKMPQPPRQMSLKLDLDLAAYLHLEILRRDEEARNGDRVFRGSTITDLILEAVAWRNDELFRAENYAGQALEMDARRRAIGFKKWNGSVPAEVYDALLVLNTRVRREVKELSMRDTSVTSLAEGLVLSWAETNEDHPFDREYPYASR